MSTFAELDLRHELRTPLAAIIGLAAMLRESSLTVEQRKMIDAIQTAGEHLSGLIDLQLLSTAIPVVGFEVEPLVTSIVDLYRPEASARGLTLTLEIDPSTPATAAGSAIYVRQLLVNLVSNALKFTSAGSVDVRLCAVVDHLVIEVADSGRGFEPHRVQPRADGSGRGLSICHQLAGELGCELHIDSLVGVGTVARFELPAA